MKDHTVIGSFVFHAPKKKNGTWGKPSEMKETREVIYYKDYKRYEDLPDVAKSPQVKAEYEAWWAAHQDE